MMAEVKCCCDRQRGEEKVFLLLLLSLTLADKRGQYDDIDKVSKLLLCHTPCSLYLCV